MHATFTCQACGVEVVRPVVRGQRPKWCIDHRNARKRQRHLLGISGPRLNGPFPSTPVPAAHPSRISPPRTPTAAQVAANEAQRRNGLGYALESGDRDGVLAFIRDRVTISPNGCWEWTQSTRDGYARVCVRVAGKDTYRFVHRLAAEAWLGEIPKGWPVHHICAVRHCVSPFHLQAVTPQANTAEMLHRRAYEARILALEEALRAVVPDHPLLP